MRRCLKQLRRGKGFVMSRSTPDVSDSRLDDLVQSSYAAERFVQAFNHLSNLQRLLARHSHYDPNQPRVPAGHPDGGQWTRIGSARTASSDEITSDVPPDNDWVPGAQYAARRGARPPMEFGQAARLTAARAEAEELLAHVRQLDPTWQPTRDFTSPTMPPEAQIRLLEGRAQEARDRLIELAASGALPILRGPSSPLHRAIEQAAIEAYRDKEGLFDLFRHPEVGPVAVAAMDGQRYFGVKSTSRAYTSRDYAAAKDLRDRVSQYDPKLRMHAEDGETPTNAFFHAETTVLLRAAKENGDTLAGRTLEMFVDGVFCPNCATMLPKVALELGNPTVIIRDRTGRTRTVRDGNIEFH